MMREFRERQCTYCEKTFTPNGARNKWCCVECRFWSHVDKSAGPDKCWPWLKGTYQCGGYGQFTVAGDKHLYAHRCCLVFSGIIIPHGHYGCHKCDNPICCNPHPKHVYVGTPSDNSNDAYAHGGKSIPSFKPNYAIGNCHGMARKRLIRLGLIKPVGECLGSV